MQELTADLTYEMLYGQNENLVYRLAAEQPGLARRILDHIKDVIGKLTGQVKTDELERLRQSFERAIVKASKGQGTQRDQYSLRPVQPVQQRTMDKNGNPAWTPGHSEQWFRENGFPIYADVDADVAGVGDTAVNGHGTQIASTRSTYEKIFKDIQKQHPNDWQNLRVLDASSGLGLGTRLGRDMGFNVDDIEPFPSSRYMHDAAVYGEEAEGAHAPMYTDYSALEDAVQSGETEGYDYIISNAVLNVIPQDTRDNLTVAMGHLLKPGGTMFVNVISRDYQGAMNSTTETQYRTTKSGKQVPVGSVRTQEGDYSTRGNQTGRGHETFVWGSNSVQKVFSVGELTAYLQDALGEGYTIKKAPFGMTGLFVTKDANYDQQAEPHARYSLPEREARQSFEYMKPFAEQLEDFIEKGARGKDTDVMYVGQTPRLLQDLGLPELPVVIQNDHVRSAIVKDGYQGKEENKAGHEIGITEFSHLLERINDPVAIFRDSSSTNTLDIIVEMRTKDRGIAYIPFRINSGGDLEGIRIESQRVSTVFDRRDIDSLLRSAIEREEAGNISVFYLNKNKARRVISGQGYFNGTSRQQSEGLADGDTHQEKQGGRALLTRAGKLPNGLIHRITEIDSPVKAKGKTDTKQFRRWFGKSVFRNEDGTPQVLYHGTSAYEDFHVFRSGKAGFLGPGIYLSDDQSIAQRYASQTADEGRVYHLYARVENPLVVTDGVPARAILEAAYGRKGIYERRSAKQSDDSKILTKHDIDKLKEKGYDGIVWRYGSSPAEISVFDPTQVKSATDNTGMFDRRNPDIRYSLPEQTQQRDEEYERAVDSGDMDTARRMVDEAAEAAGTSQPVDQTGADRPERGSGSALRVAASRNGRPGSGQRRTARAA